MEFYNDSMDNVRIYAKLRKEWVDLKYDIYVN